MEFLLQSTFEHGLLEHVDMRVGEEDWSGVLPLHGLWSAADDASCGAHTLERDTAVPFVPQALAAGGHNMTEGPVMRRGDVSQQTDDRCRLASEASSMRKRPAADAFEDSDRESSIGSAGMTGGSGTAGGRSVGGGSADEEFDVASAAVGVGAAATAGAGACSKESAIVTRIRDRRARTSEERRERQQQRMLHNRLSAKLSRERKKLQMETLQDRVTQLHRTKSDYEALIALLLDENARMKEQLRGAGSSCCRCGASLSP